MSRRFQFSLEKLLLLTAWAAILCVVGPPVMRWGGIPRKHWPVIGIVAWVAAIRIVPVVRAYQRFRDSEL
ncbi:MAG TPA: hypothetical protein VG826_24385 [Pirellulales bacterium]|nr:hypothetical protein [Pirellulales bacterium]